MTQVIRLEAADRTDGWKGVLLGCGILILGSYLRIPFHPIAFTMHTYALWMIGLTLPSRQAAGAVILYLGLATVGLPVFGGHGNPLWILGKSAGYYVGFPIAVYLAARMKERNAGIIGIVLGHCIIYFLGFLGLVPFVGPVIALQKGVLLFIPSDLLKAIFAYTTVKKFKGIPS